MTKDFSTMKPSELRAEAKAQAFMPKPKQITAGDMLAGDQYARAEWQERIAQGDAVLARLANVHKQYRDGHISLREAAEKRDPEMTPDAHFMAIRKLGQQSLERAAKASDDARERAEAEISALRSAMQTQLGLVENHRAGEVRSHLRSLSDVDRSKILQAAVADADAQTIAAVVEAPAYLSGLTNEQAKAIRGQYEGKHASDKLGRIAVLEKAVAINRETAMQALKFNSELLPSERAAEIEAKQKAARAMRERLQT